MFSQSHNVVTSQVRLSHFIASLTAVGVSGSAAICGLSLAPNFLFLLSPAETNYSTFDREVLAMYLAIKHFRHFIEGREFHVWTDHKPLTFSIATNSNCYSPRQARQLDFISQFTTNIRHVKGSNNPVGDTLSRVDINALQQPNGIDFTAMAVAQQTDPEL